MNSTTNKGITKTKVDFLNNKVRIKIGVILLLVLMILANVITAWALPNLSVECCEDFILHSIDNYIQNFDLNFKWLKSILTFLLFQSDLIFLISLVKFIFVNYDKKFLKILFWVWLLKFFTDWSFYQHNKHHNTEIATYHFYFITSQPLSRNSLFSFPLAIQFLCFLQLKNEKILKTIISINLFCSCIVLLILKTFFSFQIVFSFLIVHYLKCLID